MSSYFIVALALIVGGLLVCMLSPHSKYPTAITVFFWLGLLAAVAGACLILAKIVVSVAGLLSQALGI